MRAMYSSFKLALSAALLLTMPVCLWGADTQAPTWQLSHFKVEYTVPRPVKEVWPVFVDIRRWISDYRLEPIDWPDNIPISVGALSRAYPASPAATGQSADRYYVIDVYEVIPEKEIVLWVGAEHPDAFDVADVSTFYHWSLRESGGKTLITIENFGSRKPLHGGRNDLRQGDPKDPESYHRYRSPSRSWIKNLQTLEKLVLQSN